jgi:kynurenine formamidase
MKLPSRIVDISATLDNDTVLDPPFMRPKIEYRNHAQTAPLLCELFPGLRLEDLPEGEGWAIEQVPGVKLDFRHLPDGHVVTAAEVEAEIKRTGHKLEPFDIVLVNTRAASCIGTDEYLVAGIGMGREATLYLTSRGVRVAGIDAWGWDAPFAHMRERWLKTRDPAIIWEGHKAGREIPYCHMEKLCNLDQLPADGFMVACFPHKIKDGSAGWTRAVALFD